MHVLDGDLGEAGALLYDGRPQSLHAARIPVRIALLNGNAVPLLALRSSHRLL
jgi:hypothetical protein